MDLNALHDVLVNQILPFLFKTNTNPTSLIFRSVNKQIRKKLLDLIYTTFTDPSETSSTSPTSCNFANCIVFAGYDQRLNSLDWCVHGIPIFKPVIYTELWNLEILEDRISDKFSGDDLYLDRVYYKLSWAWNETGNIYGYYRDSLALILDESLTFKHRIELIERYLHPLSDFFENNYMSMTFWRALTKTREISNSLAERLEPHINIIIETWFRCCDANVITMISILKCMNGFELVFDQLKKQILESANITVKLFKLLLSCLELNENRTLEYLGIDWFYPFFARRKLSAFNRRSSYILKLRIYGCNRVDIDKYPNHVRNYGELEEVLSVLHRC